MRTASSVERQWRDFDSEMNENDSLINSNSAPFPLSTHPHLGLLWEGIEGGKEAFRISSFTSCFHWVCMLLLFLSHIIYRLLVSSSSLSQCQFWEGGRTTTMDIPLPFPSIAIPSSSFLVLSSPCKKMREDKKITHREWLIRSKWLMKSVQNNIERWFPGRILNGLTELGAALVGVSITLLALLSLLMELHWETESEGAGEADRWDEAMNERFFMLGIWNRIYC